jgi:two-component system chemotaxis response regulator CheY
MVYEILPKLAQLGRPVLADYHTFVLEWRGPVVHGENGSQMPTDLKQLAERFAATKVLVVDDEHYMRKVVRTMLMSIGVQDVHEAPDGTTGLELIRTVKPNVVILDWQMHGLDGPSIVRMIRSPETFPYPDVPIIMLTGHGERSHVIEAVKIGVNEFLLKPVSVKALQDRMTAVLTQPRQIMKEGNYYGPAPRNLTTTIYADNDQAIANLAAVN